MPKRIAHRQHTVKSGGEDSNLPEGLSARTPTGEAFSGLVVKILRLNGLLLAAGDALAEPSNQTSARWRVLAAVETRPMTVAQIARGWGLARQSVQRIADVLVQDGLAFYEDNPKHRRAQLLVLSPEGRSILQTIQAAQRKWANTLGAEIGEANLQAANELLSKVLEVVLSRR